jgi:hypothetical protein
MSGGWGVTARSPLDPAEDVRLIQVGWMPSPDLAEELGLHPLHDEWLSSVEMCEDQGGILPELVGRLIPIYRIAQFDGEVAP